MADPGRTRGQRRAASGAAVQRARRRGGRPRCARRWPRPGCGAARCCSTRATPATSSTSSLDGKVKLGRTSSDGRENLLAILGPGQMFGELSLFDPGPRSATVTAVTDAAFASLSHDDLLRWLEGRPIVARGLLAQLAAPAAQGQRRHRRPGLLRRPRPRRQGAARPRRPLRPHRRRRRPRPPRPHPGGARPAGRRLPRDRQQGARRLRLPRLAAPRAPLGRAHGRRAARPPRPLTASRCPRSRSAACEVVQLGADDSSAAPQRTGSTSAYTISTTWRGRASRRRRRRPQLRDGAATCSSRSRAVREVVVEAPSASSITGPWPGQTVVDLVRLGERVQPVERVEVGAELAVGVGDDGRAAAEHGVAGEHRPLRGQHERQRVGGVARGGDDVDLELVDRDHVAVAETLVAEPVAPGRARVRRSRRARRTPRAASEWSRWWWVSSTTRARRRPPRATASRWPRVGRPGVDHDRPAARRARAAPRCWCRRASSGSALGASTQVAALAERAAGPAHRGRASQRLVSRGGIEQRELAVDRRPPRA